MVNFPLDKQAHALTGVVTVLLAIYFVPLWAGLAICLAQAVGKELYDRYHPLNHTSDKWDAVATMVGGVAASVFLLLVR